jgi:hypothetical protein
MLVRVKNPDEKLEALVGPGWEGDAFRGGAVTESGEKLEGEGLYTVTVLEVLEKGRRFKVRLTTPEEREKHWEWEQKEENRKLYRREAEESYVQDLAEVGKEFEAYGFYALYVEDTVRDSVEALGRGRMVWELGCQRLKEFVIEAMEELGFKDGPYPEEYPTMAASMRDNEKNHLFWAVLPKVEGMTGPTYQEVRNELKRMLTSGEVKPSGKKMRYENL